MTAPYELIYYAGVPGRGEHILLIPEEAGAPHNDSSSLGMDTRREVVTDYLQGNTENLHYYAPPILKHGDLVISQTSNILLYLGPKLRLSGLAKDDIYRVNVLAFTALDGLSIEVHDCHHPILRELFYED